MPSPRENAAATVVAVATSSTALLSSLTKTRRTLWLLSFSCHLVAVTFISSTSLLTFPPLVSCDQSPPLLPPPLSTCSPPFGCFPSTPDFIHPLFRPINLLPETAAKVNSTFYFYSRWFQGDYSNLKKTVQLPDVVRCGVQPFDHKHPSTSCALTTALLQSEAQLDLFLERLKKEVINANQKEPSAFATSRWSAIVVHGFLDNINDGSWMMDIKNGLLKSSNRHQPQYDTVIVVDWSGGNGIPYLQATANSRLVGGQIAYLIRMLQKHHLLNTARTHIIGHSLGAQIAAYAAKELKKDLPAKLIGRITALDAASPNFEGMPASVKLTKEDATFVDAIHTNARPLYQFGYGVLERLAHLDFYPNGGLSQPGCDNVLSSAFIPSAIDRLVREPSEKAVIGSLDQIGRLVTCSHIKAIDYFVESINGGGDGTQDCRFTATPCSSWSEFLRGNSCSCSTKSEHLCPPMGFHAYEWAQQMASKGAESRTKNASISWEDFLPNNRLYLETNSQPPFCKK